MSERTRLGTCQVLDRPPQQVRVILETGKPMMSQSRMERYPVERTRTYTGTLPDNPARDAWSQAHEEYCDDPYRCDHANPYPETMPVLVHLFEGDDGLFPPAAPQIKGMEVALASGEGRTKRWTPPATMEEQT